MDEASETAPGKHARVLVIANDVGRRREIEAALAGSALEDHPPHALCPADLRESARWIDAVAAIVHLGPRDSDFDREQIERLSELPAGAHVLVLCARELDEGATSELLRSLAPRIVLDDPPSKLVLRCAFAQLVPRTKAARRQHRSSQALLGVSRAVREITEQVRQIAPSRVSVLILGETGTGKEVVARSIHSESGRSGNFVPLNCGALPEALLESELFGAERGAFTGASQARDGVFVQADGGTLFLDEIGEMPPAMQVKLLRVLEGGEVRRLGSNRSRKVDVRIVSATHRDLEADVGDQLFRQDLLFRINTATIFLPPLRRRAVDIPFLAQHFAEEFGAENAREITLSDSFIEALCEHDFPGNVRELRNAVERAIALAQSGDPITPEHLPEAIASQRLVLPSTGTLKERVARLEAHVLGETLERFDGNRTKTAEALGLSRVGLRQKLRRLAIE